MYKCEDCAPFIEEYFDGEVDAKTSERMSAHISACADCSAALEALSLEAQMYARYERGIEPTPTLWARVSAEIARTPQPEAIKERRPFLSRARSSVAAALGAFSMRPALASSLALLIVGVTAGSLWLAYRPKATLSPVVATNEPPKITAPASTPDAPPAPVPVDEPDEVDIAIARAGNVVRVRAASAARVDEKQSDQISLEELLKEPSQAQPADAPHADETDEIAGLLNAPDAVAEFADASAQLPDAGDKEIARHVEQAQMLLRSIKNARAGEEGGTVNVAYEKSLSRQLLADNATLKLEADVKGDKDTKQVLDTIEPFLLDIANMRAQASREEVRSLRERVKKTEIIASLQVY